MAVAVLNVLLFLTVLIRKSEGSECISRKYGEDSVVCVCNATYCDFPGSIAKVEQGQFAVYTSNQAGLRFDKQVGQFKKATSSQKSVVINRVRKYQRILGFGGAFTDSAGININSLSNRTKDYLLRSYFTANGSNYNLCRVPIGGTDFSTRAYSYDDDQDVDFQLKNFELAPEDFDLKIPLIKIAQTLTNNGLKVFGSAWTAPRWMKTNGQYAGAGRIKDSLYQTWADYFVKFLDAYKKEGIEFWGITTGNEPSVALIPSVTLNSVGWTPWQLSRWVSNNLGPALRRSQHSSIKLMALDDQRLFLPWYIEDLFVSKETREYVDGVAVHWYTDSSIPAIRLTETHNKFPEKFILATEACSGSNSSDRGVKLGSWSRAEDYAHDIIEDLQNWVTGWVDWNIALDTTGGPTYISNNVDSPVIVNATSDEFYKQPMFYSLAHFSKFLARGSVRIDVGSVTNLELVAFERLDNATVIVILNKQNRTVPAVFADQARGQISLNISERSVTSLIYW